MFPGGFQGSPYTNSAICNFRMLLGDPEVPVAVASHLELLKVNCMCELVWAKEIPR